MKIELSLRRQHTFRGFGPSKIEPESNKDQAAVQTRVFITLLKILAPFREPFRHPKPIKNRIKNQTTKTELAIIFAPYPLQVPPTRLTMSNYTSNISRWSLFGITPVAASRHRKATWGTLVQLDNNLHRYKPLKINKTHAQTHQTIQFRSSENACAAKDNLQQKTFVQVKITCSKHTLVRKQCN